MDTSADDTQTLRIQRSPSIGPSSTSASRKRKLSSTTFGSSPSMTSNTSPPLRSSSPSNPGVGAMAIDTSVEAVAGPSNVSPSSSTSIVSPAGSGSEHERRSNDALSLAAQAGQPVPSHHRLYPHHHQCPHAAHLPHHDTLHHCTASSGCGYDSSKASSSCGTSAGEGAAGITAPVHELHERRCNGVLEDLDYPATDDRRDPRSSSACVVVPLQVCEGEPSQAQSQPVQCRDGCANSARPPLQLRDGASEGHEVVAATISSDAKTAPTVPCDDSACEDDVAEASLPALPPSSVPPRSDDPLDVAPPTSRDLEIASLPGQTSTTPLPHRGSKSPVLASPTPGGAGPSKSAGPPSTPIFSSYFFATPSPKLTQGIRRLQGTRSIPQTIGPLVPGYFVSSGSASPGTSSEQSESPILRAQENRPEKTERQRPSNLLKRPSTTTTHAHERNPITAQRLNAGLALRTPPTSKGSSRIWARTSSSSSLVEIPVTLYPQAQLSNGVANVGIRPVDADGPESGLAVVDGGPGGARDSFQLQPVPACKKRKISQSAGQGVFVAASGIVGGGSSREEGADATRKSDGGGPMARAGSAHEDKVEASSARSVRPPSHGPSSHFPFSNMEPKRSRPAIVPTADSHASRAASTNRSAAAVDRAAEVRREPVQALRQVALQRVATSGGSPGRDESSSHSMPAGGVLTPHCTSGLARQHVRNLLPPLGQYKPQQSRPTKRPNPTAVPGGSRHANHPSGSNAGSRRRVSPRLRRAQSVPNMRAKAVVDLSQPSCHRLLLPSHWASYIASRTEGRASRNVSSEHYTSSMLSGRPTVGGVNAQASAQQLAGRGKSVFTPSLHPPITRHTLRELDLFEILKNPQLRHDVVFDPNVQFRPNFDGERGRRKREAGERYWTAVVREIENGCTCTAFDHGEILPCVCNPRQLRGQASHSVSGKGSGGNGGVPASRSTRGVGSSSMRIPSRIPLLVQELRAICLSILPSNFPVEPSGAAVVAHSPSRTSTSPSAASGRSTPDKGNGGGRGSVSASRDASPTSSRNAAVSSTSSGGGPAWAASHHSLIAQTLDPHLISQELQHGVLDVPALVTFMGSILKLHCAPMRDEAIERMVEVVCVDGDVGKGLRLCFEILELMKLDIANHQLRSTRPYLVETAVEFEIRWFREQIEQGKTSLERTSAWFISALCAAKESNHQTLSRSDLVTRAFNAGLLKLIFDSPSSLPLASIGAPDAGSSSSLSSSSLSNVVPPTPSPSSSSLNHTFSACYPETFQFDAYRMMTFHNDVADLTIVYMLLLLFRQLACSPLDASSSTVPATAASVAQRQAEAVKGEIWCLLNDANLCISGSAIGAASSSPTSSSARRPLAATPSFDGRLFLGSAGGLAKLEYPRWRAAMQNVLLQVASRAASVQYVAKGLDPVSNPPPPPSAKTQALLNSWLDTNLCAGSALHKLCQRRLSDVLVAMLSEKVGAPSVSTSMATTAVAGAAQASSTTILRKRTSSEEDETAEADTPNETTTQKKRVKTDEPPPSRVTEPGRREWEKAIQKAGLEPFTPEIKMLCERVTKVATFHLRVFRNLYERMEGESVKEITRLERIKSEGGGAR
ncbi:hypothetical protein IE53DRAFT_409975 [Violaceomyces palustris]|uniref:Uncharacterized protein n=1 Tax=Violaceomyces palustris TaxID=1673888 RepID=A0ACD0P0X3_9BASI|nr:hypothetical protein IE53DRAFT_409975 [Violaceomyces palustris]